MGSIGSTSFAFLVTFQSIFSVYFFFYTGDDLFPTYIKWVYKKLYKNKTNLLNNEGSVHFSQQKEQQQEGDYDNSFENSFLYGQADNFKTDKELNNNRYWQTVSKKFDEFSKYFFLVSYAIFLITIWTLK